jgi:hypothetical protein
MLAAAGLSAGMFLPDLARLDLDGRSIRNLVRVLDLVTPPLVSGEKDRFVALERVLQVAKNSPGLTKG